MKRLISVVLISLLVAVLVPPADAQDKPAKFLQRLTITVKPGMNHQYEEFVTKLVEASKKVGRPVQWTGGQTGFGGSGRTYMFYGSSEEWADLDNVGMSNTEVLDKAFGEKEAAKILRLADTSIEDSSSTVLELVDEFTVNYRSRVQGSKFYWVNQLEVIPEMVSEWRVVMAKWLAVWEKDTDIPLATRSNVFGEGFVYSFSTPYDKWSELDSEPDGQKLINEAYGEEEARHLMDSWLRCIKSTNSFILTTRPDLSYLPAASPTN